jgi:BRCA1-associated protein
VYTPTDVTVAHKLETVNQEYQELISSTLLQQKSYHQSQLELKSIDRFVHLEGIITLVQSENSVLKSECRRLTNALETSIRNADKIQTKYERSCKKVESLMQSLDEEREVSTRLLQNYQQLQASHAQIQDVTVKNLETKVDELQEQVRDLMFFLETREKVSSGEMRDEISGASVIGVVASSPPPAQSPSTPGRKGRKKK